MKDEIKVSKAIIENNDGEILALQKSENYDWKAGKWELPGGKIKDSEDRFETARRETKSETCLQLSEIQDVVRVKVEEEEKIVDCWLVHTKSFEGEIQLSDEHENFQWIKPQEFKDLNWHRDAGYSIPAIEHLEEYMK